MGNTRNTGYLQNIVLYDANDNITLPARLAVTGTVSVNNTTPYDTTQFSLDINGGLIVKNINKTAQFVLINSNPASGGNNAFVVHTVGGTSAASYADIQGYYGTSVAGSTVLRLNPQGGNVLVGSLAGTGSRMVVASATGVLSTQAIVTLGDLSGVPTSRTISINGTTYDLSADRSFTINSMVYPTAGIAVSTGSAWGTSITDNSTNWNTAYGWGNHASAGYLTTSSAASTYVSLSGSYANPSWITSLAYSKITGVPAFLTSYTETDTLATVTGRGASTSTQVTFSGAGDNTVSYSSVRFSGYNQGGGVGYHGFFEIQNTYGSVTNGKKFFRIDGTGSIQIINSAYTANIFNLTDAGVLTVGSIIKSGGTSNQFLKADGSVDSSTYLTGITSSQVTTALGYTPYNATNPSGYISSYTETSTLANVTSRGATTSTALTLSGRVTFSSAVANRPQLPGGMLGLDTSDGNFDIWGISRDYYPSHSTASNAWGLRWNGDNNDFEFVGAGTNRVVLDMDGGNVTATGNITGANLSGTNTGDQTNISGNAGTVTNGVYTTGSYANPAWITSLAYSKITGVPAFITSYTETDTLASVTGRGATTTAAITISKEALAYGGTTQSFLIDGAGGNAALTINAASAYAYLNFAQTGVTKWEIGAEGAATNKGSLYFNHNIQQGSTGAALYIKKSNGYVGILNTDPQVALHVTGAGTFTGNLNAANLSGTNTGDQTNISGYAMSLNGYTGQTEYTILTGPANGPVIKVRYDGATANRYIDIGSKDGNGIYSEGLKIYNGGTLTFGGYTIYHSGNIPTWNQNTTGTANNITAYTINQNVGTGNSPTFAGLTINTGGSGTWGQFVVNSTSLWGDGATLYTTIGAGGAAGVMLFNPHVVWNSGSSCAGIRIGRSGGTSSGKYYEIGTGASDNFFIAKEGLASGTQLNINSSGNATFSGTITASNFSGSHSGTSSGTNTGDQTSVSGSAGSAGYADRIQTGNNQWTWTTGAHTATNPNTITLWDQYSNYGGSGNPTSYGTILDIYGRSGHEHDQLYFGESGQFLHRNCFYGGNTWSSWRTILNSSNYNSYSPTLTGGGASGTWSINITGGAGSANVASVAYQVVTIQDSAPGGVAGKLWWESDTGKLKVYYGSAWVDASPIPDSSLFFAKAGGSITGDVSIGQTLNVVGNTLVQGTISAFGDVIAYSSSDSRLKDNITVIESPLEKLSKINGVSFNWNDKQTAYEVGKKDIGVIAQEVEEVLPELVTTRDNGYKAVRYEKIVALLIEAIKEQQVQINSLTDKLNNL